MGLLPRPLGRLKVRRPPEDRQLGCVSPSKHDRRGKTKQAGRHLAAALLLAATLAAAPLPPARTPRLALRVVAIHPHDPGAYTQGLLFHAGKLYESTGMAGASRLREVEIASGRALREVALPRHQFGEGLARAGSRLVQLTWLDGVAHVWNLADFTAQPAFRYTGEGWGLEYDGRRFVQSDGTSRLTFRDAESFEPTGQLTVTRDGVELGYLNELELARGLLFANVWLTEEIVAIDLADGRVVATYEATGLLAPDEAARADILNGIAHDPTTGRFYLTGKWWPKLFEVELPEPNR